jgi:aspartate 1-decarboxylase
LSPYVRKPEFDFVAANNLDFEGSVTFDGLSSSSTLRLIAGNQIIFSPGVTLRANVTDFELAAPGAMTLDGVDILNNAGVIGLTSGSVINIENGVNINNLGTTTLTAPDAVNITSDTDDDVGLDATDINTDPATGHVTLSSIGGSVNVTGTSIQTHYLTLDSGDNILLDASGKTLTATGAGSTANFTAPNLITVNNANLDSFGAVNMAANTINLLNVAFGTGSSVSLESLNGVLAANPNTGAASVPGDVNFIQNVTYGGNPAQNYVNNGGGITVSTYIQGGGAIITPVVAHR